MRYEEDAQIKLHFPHVLLAGKTWAGGTALNRSNIFLCRPQEVNDLARKNKDSIEGLAEEVGKFKVQ